LEVYRKYKKYSRKYRKYYGIPIGGGHTHVKLPVSKQINSNQEQVENIINT